MIQKIKILGLQRSGTNWIEVLIRSNLKVFVYDKPLDPFFKHAFPNEHRIMTTKNTISSTPVPYRYVMEHPNEIFLIVQKPLQKWIESISRHPADLRQKHPEIFSYRRVNEGQAVAMYERYHFEWNSLHLDNIYTVDYLGVLVDYSLFLQRFSEQFSIDPFSDVWQNTDKVPHSRKFTEKDKKRYLS